MFSRIVFGILALFVGSAAPAAAQVSDGSIAPDFTFTDVNGKSHNLYTYLDSGHYVALEVSATWCEPCWEYHERSVMDSLYNLHEVGGQKNWKVFFIEGDKSTTRSDLEGTGDRTLGNWTGNRSFTFIDPEGGEALSNFLDAYEVTFFPSLFLICPDRRVYREALNGTPRPDVRKWEELAASGCKPTGIDSKEGGAMTLDIFPNPTKGEINIRFSSANSTSASLTITNTLGQVMVVKEERDMTTGNNLIHIPAGTLKPGIYFFTLQFTNGATQVRKVVIR